METKNECWSHNNEDFNHETLGDLLDLHDMQPGDTVYVGESVRPEVKDFINTLDVIENMGERAYDIGGEYAEDFPDITKEAEQELESLLIAWAEKHCTINFWTVRNVKPYTLTAEDFVTVPAGSTA